MMKGLIRIVSFCLAPCLILEGCGNAGENNDQETAADTQQTAEGEQDMPHMFSISAAVQSAETKVTAAIRRCQS